MEYRFETRSSLVERLKKRGLISLEVFSHCNEDSSFSEEKKYLVLSGLTDVHVHLREPGFFYKESIKSGSRACAHGGITAACTMPNLDPVPDCIENLRVQSDIIESDSAVRLYPYGAISKGERGCELSDMEALAPYVIAFSDDGHGVQSEDLMREAMKKAKSLGKIIAAHCEDNSLLNGGYIHAGRYAAEHGHAGIPSECEWRQIARDIGLARETGCSYHVCHVSTKESVSIIRRAKAEGIDVTCETAPHYLLLDDSFMQEDGRFKMNPPLRGASDREALLEGIADGTIDMLITDHAPHSVKEKAGGLRKSAMGVVGVETSFALMYTYLVKSGKLSLQRLCELMHDAPCSRFGIDTGDDFAVFDLDASYKIDPDKFLSKGRSTPFADWEVFGKCMLTVCRGRIVYSDEDF
ncbi:MAG: dihydroorotase [Synergistes sp.]|nr:dihydroorotase [Synergistes sp.]